LHLGSLYIAEVGNTYTFSVAGTKALTLESDGGILHGSWSAESSLVTSDRRLKKEIMPLQRTLRNVMNTQEPPASLTEASAEPLAMPSATTATRGGPGDDGAMWLLRQLRPVSYSFRKGAESKYMRFGFIADELESVVPQVVRTVGNKQVADQKAVVYQDLIALLAAATQSLSAASETQQSRINTLEATLKDVRDKLVTFEEESSVTAPPPMNPSTWDQIQQLRAEISAVSSERKALEEQMAELQASQEAEPEQEESRGTWANLMQRRRTAP
jgi:hypothetical protein